MMESANRVLIIKTGSMSQTKRQASLGWFDRCHHASLLSRWSRSWMAPVRPVVSDETDILAPRCRKLAIHPIIQSPRRPARAAWAGLKIPCFTIHFKAPLPVGGAAFNPLSLTTASNAAYPRCPIVWCAFGLREGVGEGRVGISRVAPVCRSAPPGLSLRGRGLNMPNHEPKTSGSSAPSSRTSPENVRSRCRESMGSVRATLAATPFEQPYQPRL